MGYNQQTWVDEEVGGTPVNAERLNVMEGGIQEASDRLDVVEGERGLLATISRSGTENTDATASSADVDAAELVVEFTVPESGRVVVILHGWAEVTNKLYWGLREASSDVAGTYRAVLNVNADGQLVTARILVTGLTPGDAKTWKWAHKVSSVSTVQRIRSDDGTNYAPAVMEVWAA